jgi:hypothetical protein
MLCFFCFVVLMLVAAIDEEGNEMVRNDVGIPIRKWKNRARRQREMYELRRKLEAEEGTSPDLDLLEEYYSNPTKFEEKDDTVVRKLQTETQYDVVIIGSGWAGLAAGKYFCFHMHHL